MLPEGCDVRWSGSGPLQKFVYNRDFVQRSLAQSSQIKGIFTLGSATTETVQRIEQLKVEITEIREKIENRKRTLNGPDGTAGKNGELREAHANFAETCWVAKRAHDASLGNAFTGVRGDKTKFRDRLLQEKRTNQASQQSLDYLTQLATSVFTPAMAMRTLSGASHNDPPVLRKERQATFSRSQFGLPVIPLTALVSEFSG